MNLYIKKNPRCDECAEMNCSSDFIKKCVCTHLGVNEADAHINLKKAEYGKPFIEEMRLRGTNITPPYFSLSHSADKNEFMYICAIGGQNVGADCQKRHMYERQRLEKITARFYTADEREFLASISEYKEYAVSFYDIWAKKEAYIKYTGKGLSQGLDTFSVLETSRKFCEMSFITPQVDETTSIAVCVEKSCDKTINVIYL